MEQNKELQDAYDNGYLAGHERKMEILVQGIFIGVFGMLSIFGLISMIFKLCS